MKKGFLVILIVIAVFILSWAITCGIIKLITICFGWKFSIAIATGIWLIFILLNSMLGNSKK